MIKFNCDAFVSEIRGSGIAFVGRDERGDFLFAGHKFIAFTAEVELAEAEAILWALRFADERGLKRIHSETDCLGVVDKLSKGDSGKGPLSSLIAFMKTFASNFDCIKWSFIRRDGNKVAHSLANIRPFASSLFFSLSSLPLKTFVHISLDNE